MKTAIFILLILPVISFCQRPSLPKWGGEVTTLTAGHVWVTDSKTKKQLFNSNGGGFINIISNDSGENISLSANFAGYLQISDARVISTVYLKSENGISLTYDLVEGSKPYTIMFNYKGKGDNPKLVTLATFTGASKKTPIKTIICMADFQ